MIRSFRLYNDRGDMIDMLENLDFLAFNPEGLGVKFDNGFSQTDANFIFDKTKVVNTPLKLRIVFGALGENPYQKYSEFLELLNHPPYVLEYILPEGAWKKKIRLNELSKGEITIGTTLVEEITFDTVTPWYNEIANETTIVPGLVGGGKIFIHSVNAAAISKPKILAYPQAYSNLAYIDSLPQRLKPTESAFIYDGYYDGYYDGKNGVFQIENTSKYLGSAKSSPIEISIKGPSIDPYWHVIKDGKILQSDGFNITVPEGWKLVVSSVPNEQRAVLINPDGDISNVYAQQRLDLTNFVRLPFGQSQLVFYNTKHPSYKYREESVVV